MVRYDGAVGAEVERVKAAFGELGIPGEMLGDSVALMSALRQLTRRELGWLVGHLRRFGEAYGRRRAEIRALRDWRYEEEGVAGLEAYVRLVAGRVWSRPVYYLWQRKTESLRDEEVIHHEGHEGHEVKRRQ